MNGSTLRRRAASAAALAVTAAALSIASGPAGAEPTTPLETATEALTIAAGENAEAQAGVNATVKAAQLVTAARLNNITFTPFGYSAPTIGCGSNMPFTMTVASAVAGVDGPDTGLAGPPGTLRFQATPAHSGMPLASGLSVAWLNVANGRSGINALDEMTEYNLPALAKTVDSGPGTVVASLWGTIDYPAARCVVFPTVGLFTVPDLPKAPAPSTDPAVPNGTGETGSGGTPAAPNGGADTGSGGAPAL
ncbi:hypothetical protein JK358_17485 [Nocardia sp. 2]|uniref:Uncharacterized protein n=1 Tax=Nocardia acididurans TaxID=2802282 RepID=A0ABS1M8W8_9NOCA|nr:hypothetical protein [Nocardia acididurans]MBL1076194.1 hypothetical protein [Nocardia acididurans]